MSTQQGKSQGKLAAAQNTILGKRTGRGNIASTKEEGRNASTENEQKKKAKGEEGGQGRRKRVVWMIRK